MKTWKNPEIVELNINTTAQGGKNAANPDANWTDQNGNAWTSYASGGDLGGDPVIITPTDGGGINVK